MDQFFEAFSDANAAYDIFKHHKLVLIGRYEDKHCKGKSTDLQFKQKVLLKIFDNESCEVLRNLFPSYLLKQAQQ